MTYQEIISKVSKDNEIPIEIVDKVYKSFWYFIRNSIQELPLKEELTEDEFLSLRTNFNVPSLGKLCVSYDRYKAIKERFNHIKNLRKRNEESD